MSNNSKEYVYIIDKSNEHKVVCEDCLEKLLEKGEVIYYR